MIALNVTDLLICCFSLANIFIYNHQAKELNDNLSPEIFDSINVGTQILVLYPLGYLSCLSCFITVMLSTTRALALAKPFYTLRKRYVSLAFCICAFVLITLFAIKSSAYYILNKQDKNFANTLHAVLRYMGLLEMVLISVTVLVVGVSSGISIKSLRSSNESLNESSRNDNSRKASIMILTLSIVFVICNGTWSIIWLPLIIFRTETSTNEDEVFMGLFINLAVILVNSSINPIVYMIKNSALNSYLGQCWMDLRRLLEEHHRN